MAPEFINLVLIDPITLQKLTEKGYIEPYKGEYVTTTKGDAIIGEFLQNLANLG